MKVAWDIADLPLLDYIVCSGARMIKGKEGHMQKWLLVSLLMLALQAFGDGENNGGVAPMKPGETPESALQRVDAQQRQNQVNAGKPFPEAAPSTERTFESKFKEAKWVVQKCLEDVKTTGSKSLADYNGPKYDDLLAWQAYYRALERIKLKEKAKDEDADLIAKAPYPKRCIGSAAEMPPEAPSVAPKKPKATTQVKTAK